MPYIREVLLNPNHPLDPRGFPGNLPIAKNLHLTLRKPVTFFVGENGSGKSTLLEALAVRSRLPIGGGGMNELASRPGPEEESELARGILVGFAAQPPDRWFFRADTQAHFASMLDARRDDPDFDEPAYSRYGGRSLHHRSHGEAFLAVMENRFDQGLLLLDEPESALSPQRQLALLVLLHRLTRTGLTQVIVATHSPILMTFPGAEILSFDSGKPTPITLEETSHFQITRGVLDAPERYWRHLREEDGAGPA